MRVYVISLFNLFLLQVLILMAGIMIEVALQESGSKFSYRNPDRSLVTGIGIEIGLQEMGSKLVTKLDSWSKLNRNETGRSHALSVNRCW